MTGTEWSDMRRSRVVVPDYVVGRGFASETVLLNIRTGEYHGLDRVGGRFYEVIRDAPDLERASQLLISEYDQPADRIESDLAAFCDDLRNRGLIEIKPTDDN